MLELAYVQCPYVFMSKLPNPLLNGCTSMGAAYLLRRYSCGAHPHRVTTRSATCLNVPAESCSAQLECEMVSGIAIAGHRLDWAAWAALA